MTSEQHRGGEEVDLGALFASLWAQKLLIVCVTVAFLLMAALYAFTRQPVYQADLVIVAPSHNDISSLNYGRGEVSGLPLLSVADVYGIYTRYLQSESARRRVFNEHYLPSLPAERAMLPENDVYRTFSRAFVITKVGDATSARYLMSISGTDAAATVKLGETLAETAGAMTKDELLKNVMSDAALRATMLSKEIAGKREAAHKEREDRLSKLKEALSIAVGVGLKKSLLLSGNASEFPSRMDDDLAYMRGSDAIQAEISNLLKRESDDPFIGNLRQLEERMRFYRDLRIEDANLKVYQWDGALAVPDKPVKPRKMLILVAAGIAGAAIGLFMALINFFVRGKRERFA